MEKTKLQELCQKKQWGLPKYSTMKDGEEHNPRFKSSVSVNGQTFHSLLPSKSSKDAQNDAANLAFIHFTTGSGSSEAQPSSEPNTSGVPKKIQDPQTQSDASVGVVDDLQSHYKSQLQNYARSKNLDSPLYAYKTDGPSHAIRFKATVTVSGHSFESPVFFRTLKEAEHAAAKAALVSLSPDALQKDDFVLYKNLLQELAQREDFSIPIYKTIKSGASHMPTFFSTVEVEGEIFRGNAGKSKKQAELNAAKVAYSALKECELSRNTAFASANLVEDELLKTTSSSTCSTIKCGEPAKESTVDEVQEVGLAETLSANAIVSNEDSSSSLELKMDKNIENGNSFSCPESVPSSSKQGLLSYPTPTFTHPDLSALSITESKTEKNAATSSYLLCNRVRVYSSFPGIAFPKGITVLPISDNKWVAVSLEFPNEEGN